MEYKCVKCGNVMNKREDTCPQCGAKMHYCKHKGCDKQLFDESQKYCAYHKTKRNDAAKKIGKGVLIGTGVVLSVPLVILTAGKFNPTKFIKK